MPRWSLPVAFIFGLTIVSSSAAQQPCPSPSSTYELIQNGIFEVHGCTLAYCHGDQRADGLDLRAGKSYSNLMEGHDADVQNGDYPLIEPRVPGRSLLWLKLAAKTLRLRGIPGEPMPIGGLPLKRDELEGIQLWIMAGAPESGIVDGVSERIAGCTQAPQEDSGPLPPCDQNDPTLLLPDLKPQPPADIRVTVRDGHRFLEFSTTIANSGEGPLIVQAAEPATHLDQNLDAIQIILRRDGSKCARPAGMIRLKPDGHWAYAHVCNFELRKNDPRNGDLFALMAKAYFCLLDTDVIRSTEYRPHQFEAHCTDEIGRQGISAGYMDTYNRVLPGQWMDLDSDPEMPVPPGNYFLVNIANPTNMLWERNSSRDENLSSVAVNIQIADPDPVVQPSPPSQPTPSSPASPPPSQPTPLLPRHTVRTPLSPHAPYHTVRTPLSPHAPHHTVRAPLSPHAPHAPTR